MTAAPIPLRFALSRATACRPSRRVLAAASMFGLGVDENRWQTVLPATNLTIKPGQLIYITGPSGGGKTSLLSAVAAHAIRSGARVLHTAAMTCDDHRPLLDVLCSSGKRWPLQCAMRLLATVGLADAFVFLRTPGQLSDGQRYRFRLALALQQVLAGSSNQLHILIADEFAATLDRTTAKVIAANLRRWLGKPPASQRACVLVATTHDDLLEALQPDVVIEKQLGNTLELAEISTNADAQAPPPGLKRPVHAIRQGTRADYLALAAHHYRGGLPATFTRVLAMDHVEPSVIDRHLRRPATPRVIAVLVESLPSLSCSLRDVAVGDRYRALASPRDRAVVLNREFRTISRVVVHPQFRSLGLAVQLVQHALRTATTPCTEAIAAMGHVHPFFEQAGMTANRRPPHRQDARLRDALRACGISLSMLAHLPTTLKRIAALEPSDRELLYFELRRWHTGSFRGKRDSDPAAALQQARQRLTCEPVYYLNRTPRKSTFTAKETDHARFRDDSARTA